MTSSKAARASSASSESPAASLRTASCSAFAGGLADTQCLDETFRKARLRCHERDHEAEQPYAFHVFVNEDALHDAIGEVDDADELTVIHERKADERSAREILIAQERMILCLCDVLNDDGLSCGGHFAGYALPYADARAFVHVGRNA